MFRKKTAKKPTAIRRRADSDNDQDDNAGPSHDETATTQQIQETRKKRKLLTAVQYKRGVDATQLMQREPATSSGSSSGTKQASATPAVKTAAETSRDGALDRKHREAMEAFIEERMGKDKTEEVSSEEQQNPSSKPLTEEALYMDLAAQSAKLAGKPLQEEDDEQRGAVLVAGTGIAEVILPVTERLKVAQETELAKANRSRPAGSLPAGSAPPAAVPNRFAVASTMSHSEFNSQYSRDHVPSQSTKDPTIAESESMADSARPGFESTRQSSRPTAKGTTSKRDQASDHKVFTKFVTRQRELRK